MKIKNIHDKYFRRIMSNATVAREFCEIYLSPEILKLINLHTLELQDSSLLDVYLRQRMVDVLYRVQLKNSTHYIYLLFEHQSRPVKMMPFRVLEYKFAIMQKYALEALPVVIAIVFYHGKKPYPYGTSIFDLFGKEAELAKTTFLQPFTLIDIHKISDNQIKQHKWLGVLEFMHKHIYDTNLLERLEEIVPLLNELEHRDASWYIISTLEYAIHAGHLDSEEQLDNFVSQYLSAPLRSRTMTLAKKLLLRGEALGIEKGLEKGLEKGVAKEKAAIAIKLLSENFTLDLISRVTDLSISELQQLAKTTTQV